MELVGLPLPANGICSEQNQINLKPGVAQNLANVIIRSIGQDGAFLELRKPFQSMPGSIPLISDVVLPAEHFEKLSAHNAYKVKVKWNIPVAQYQDRNNALIHKTVFLGRDDFMLLELDVNSWKNTKILRYTGKRILWSNVTGSGDGATYVKPMNNVDVANVEAGKGDFLEVLHCSVLFYEGKQLVGVFKGSNQQVVPYKSSDATTVNFKVISDWVVVAADKEIASDTEDLLKNTHRFLLYQSSHLVAYGGKGYFYSFFQKKSNKMQFKKVYIASTEGALAETVGIYTMFTHVIQQNLNTNSIEVMYIVTTDRRLLAYIYENDPTYSGSGVPPKVWRRISEQELPGYMLGKDAWCLTAQGTKILVLRNGLYELGQQGYNKINNFFDFDALESCDYAKIIFSRNERMYILVLYYVASDLSIRCRIYMADQDVLSWSQCSLGDAQEAGSSLRNKIAEKEDALFLDEAPQEVVLLSGSSVDFFGLRFGQQVWYTPNLFAYTHQDLVVVFKDDAIRIQWDAIAMETSFSSVRYIDGTNLVQVELRTSIGKGNLALEIGEFFKPTVQYSKQELSSESIIGTLPFREILKVNTDLTLSNASYGVRTEWNIKKYLTEEIYMVVKGELTSSFKINAMMMKVEGIAQKEGRA